MSLSDVEPDNAARNRMHGVCEYVVVFRRFNQSDKRIDVDGQSATIRVGQAILYHITRPLAGQAFDSVFPVASILRIGSRWCFFCESLRSEVLSHDSSASERTLPFF